MQFGRSPPLDAAGAILAHGVRALSFRKGRVLSEADIAALAAAGIAEVTLARLEPGDVPEDQAASRVARVLAGSGVRLGAAFTGRANLYAQAAGLALVDMARVHALNALDEAVTLATLPPFAPVTPRQMLATIKIIPFAAPEATLAAIEAQAGGAIAVAPFQPHQVALISTRLPDTKPALLDKNRAALEAKLAPLGSAITFERRVAHDASALAAAIGEAAAAGADPILIFGASAIADRRDVIPAAIEKAGGSVSLFGMPVDPGNLLLMGSLGRHRIVGLPGCARSPKRNGFDFVLWRLLAGLPAGRAEIAAMGVGGLLSEIPTRPQPREPALPRIAALVLAAGRSSRMGSNKLLEPVGGMPMVRHAVLAALASADPVIVVTGNESAKIQAALSDLPVRFCENPDFSNGLSTSLICGLKQLPEDCDGALILLGDMPGVDAGLLDHLIAAFDPGEDRAIIVATRGGKRGNPVLWARRFFPAMGNIKGDFGARSLFGHFPGLVCEVEAGNDAPLTDIDTQEALTAYRGKAAAP